MMVPRLPVLLLLATTVVARAAEAPREAAPEKTGLAVGQKAPAFTLKDQNGQDIALAALLRQGAVAVVFHRSADW
jgi:cytochrome oxidase Cu insertion factor (SCO1/SenC/PrrC family)